MLLATALPATAATAAAQAYGQITAFRALLVPLRCVQGRQTGASSGCPGGGADRAGLPAQPLTPLQGGVPPIQDPRPLPHRAWPPRTAPVPPHAERAPGMRSGAQGGTMPGSCACQVLRARCCCCCCLTAMLFCPTLFAGADHVCNHHGRAPHRVRSVVHRRTMPRGFTACPPSVSLPACIGCPSCCCCPAKLQAERLNARFATPPFQLAVPLLEPHAAELEGLITQLREALQALAAMVAGTVSLERCGGDACRILHAGDRVAAAMTDRTAPLLGPCLMQCGAHRGGAGAARAGEAVPGSCAVLQLGMCCVCAGLAPASVQLGMCWPQGRRLASHLLRNPNSTCST